MSDRDGLRRRAEVLQKVADQLSAQLRVERWSNKELRKLRGEPPALGSYEEDRLAARRFVTFASVAVLTAAAVALLVSRPWRGADVVEGISGSAGISATAMGSTIVPFTVVTTTPAPARFIPITDLRPPSPLPAVAPPGLSFDADDIFAEPAPRIELRAPTSRRHRALVIDDDQIFGPRRGRLSADDIFGPSPREEDRHVP